VDLAFVFMLTLGMFSPLESEDALSNVRF